MLNMVRNTLKLCLCLTHSSLHMCQVDILTGRVKAEKWLQWWSASPDCGQRDGAHVVAGFSVASITVTSPLAGTRDFSVLKLPGNSQDPSLTTTHGSPVFNVGHSYDSNLKACSNQ